MFEMYDCKSVLKKMTKKNQAVVIKRLGLNGEISVPIEEVCEEYQISRQRVRQLESRFCHEMIENFTKKHVEVSK